MKKNLIYCIALGAILCSCSAKFVDVEENETSQTKAVNLRISSEKWSDAVSRTVGDLPSPVTLLLVPDGGSDVITKKVVEDNDFSLEVPHGSYEIFAVCGLDEDLIPENILNPITIKASELGMPDFAVGSATVTNEYGKLSTSSVSITAERQMAWLTVKVTEIPDDLTLSYISIKCLGNSYNIADSWSTSDNGKNKFTKFFFGSKDANNTVTKDMITIPCTDKTNGTEFRIVGRNSENKTLTYSYTSATQMIAGKHLTLNLSINDLVLVSETVDLEDWDDHEESGTLTNPTVE